MFTRFLPPLLVGLALTFALASCSKKKDENANAFQSEIRLQDAQDGGCLNLPKLFNGIKSIEPGSTAIIVPTAISFESPYAIRDAFRKLIAYGQLVVQHQSMAEVQKLPAVSQEGCSKVTVTGSDGVPKDFTVKTSAPDSLMAEAEDGERIDYTWLSTRSILSKHRYAAFDQPCSPSDKPVLVTVGKVTDWSGAVPDQVPATGSPYSIDESFIGLAASAVGDSADSVYSAAAAGRMIDLEKVGAISTKPPRPEVVTCGGVAAPVPETPDPSAPQPGTNPDDPLNPDHPHGNDTPGPNR